MKGKILCSILIFCIIGGFYQKSYAKYVNDIQIDVANIELDRTIPDLIYENWYIVNSYTESDGKRYHSLKFGMKIIEINLAEDNIKKEMITTLVNGEKKDLEIVVTETEHTETEHRYEIQLLGITGNGSMNVEVRFQRGAVTDKTGWTNLYQTCEWGGYW